MESYRERNASPPSLLIAAHCSTIKRKASDLDAKELSSILDDLARELNTQAIHLSTYINSLNKIVKVLNASFPPILTQVSSHYFFILVRDTIRNFLLQLSATKKLNSDEIYVLRNCVLLMNYLADDVEDVSKVLHWITDATFLDSLADILSRIKKVSKKKHNRQAIKQITRLLNTFCVIQERLPVDQHQNVFARLLEPTTECLKSSTYTKLFHNLQPNAESLTEIEKLYLIKCPYFLTTYEGPRIEQEIEQILDVMLPRYVTILNDHIKAIKQWKRPMMRAIHNLIITIVYAEGYFGSYTKTYPFRQLIDHLFVILNEPTLIDQIHPTSNNIATLLIDATLTVFTVLVYESSALDYIKKRAPANVFRQLTKVPYETIALNAYMMLAYTIDDQDMRTVQDDLTKLLSTTFNLLKKTIGKIESNANSNRDELDRNLIQLLETLKGLAQYEQIHDEIIKQGIMPFLIDSYKKLNGQTRQVLLECLWKFSFNQKMAQQLREQTEFIQVLAELPKPAEDSTPSNALRRSNSHSSRRSSMSVAFMEATNYGIQKVADGILWKLNREPQLREKAIQQGALSGDGLVPKFKYDIMISHSPADREIVSKVQKLLSNEGYKIWFDRDHNHAQAIETVAEIIDNSEFVIICISDSYKRDNYCQTQAEYALHLKRQILPLIVQKGYRLDGWLIPLINNNISIDFGTFNFNIPAETLLQEIKQRQHKKEMVTVKSTNTSTTTHSTLRDVPDSLDRSLSSSETTRDQQTITAERTVSRSTTPATDISAGVIASNREQQAVLRPPSRSSITNVTGQQTILNPPVSTPFTSNFTSSNSPAIVNGHTQSILPEILNIKSPIPVSTAPGSVGVDNRLQHEPSIRSVSRSSPDSSTASSGSFHIDRQQQQQPPPPQGIADNPTLRAGTPSSISSDASVATALLRQQMSNSNASFGSTTNHRPPLPLPPQKPLQSILKPTVPVPVPLNTPVNIETNQQQSVLTDVQTFAATNTALNNRQLPPPQQQLPSPQQQQLPPSLQQQQLPPPLQQRQLPPLQQQQLPPLQQRQQLSLTNGAVPSATTTAANTVLNNRQLPPLLPQQQLPPPLQQQQLPPPLQQQQLPSARQQQLPPLQQQQQLPLTTGAVPSTTTTTAATNTALNNRQLPPFQHQQQQTWSATQPLTNGAVPSATTTAANTVLNNRQLPLLQQQPPLTNGRSPSTISTTTNTVQSQQMPLPLKSRSTNSESSSSSEDINLNKQQPQLQPQTRAQPSTQTSTANGTMQLQAPTPVQNNANLSVPNVPQVVIQPTSTEQHQASTDLTIQQPVINTASPTSAPTINHQQLQQQQQQQTSLHSTPKSLLVAADISSTSTDAQKQRSPSRAFSRPTTPATSAAIVAVTHERAVTPAAQTNNQLKPPLLEEYTKRKTENSNYRNRSTDTWKNTDVLDYLFDHGLYSMMPLCEAMSGKALLRLFRMCQSKPSRLYDQLNDELRIRFNGLNLSMGVYTQFLIEMDALFSSITDALPPQLDSAPKIIERVIYMPRFPNGTDRLSLSTQPSPGSSMLPLAPPPGLRTIASFEPSSGITTPRNSKRTAEKVGHQRESKTRRSSHFYVQSPGQPGALLNQVQHYANQSFQQQRIVNTAR